MTFPQSTGLGFFAYETDSVHVNLPRSGSVESDTVNNSSSSDNNFNEVIVVIARQHTYMNCAPVPYNPSITVERYDLAIPQPRIDPPYTELQCHNYEALHGINSSFVRVFTSSCDTPAGIDNASM